MKLAIETSTDVCSVAIKKDDEFQFEKRSETKGTHSENLFLFMDELREEHNFEIPDLDAIIISQGPGSYTGLRIAASAIKGLLFQHNVPLYGVNTLASFASAAVQSYPQVAKIHSVIDAKRKHLYHQTFSVEGGVLTAVNTVETRPISNIEQLIQPNEVIVGTGIDRLKDDAYADCPILTKDAISARSLFEIEQTAPNDFIRKVDIKRFEPNYYTSNQPSS